MARVPSGLKATAITWLLWPLRSITCAAATARYKHGWRMRMLLPCCMIAAAQKFFTLVLTLVCV
jgi:hypothetical protein